MQRSGDLHTLVLDHLGPAIVGGEYPEGSVLDLDAVAARLDVSRSVLREALRVLASLGLIEARHKVGTRVLPRTEWDLLHPNVIAWRAAGPGENDQLRDLLQLRRGVEPLAARLVAGRLDGAALDTMARACADLETAAAHQDRADFLRADEIFHAAILSNCGNELVARFERVVLAALRARQREPRSVTTEWTPASLTLHRRLVSALRSATEAANAGESTGPAATRAERIARQLVEMATTEMGWEP
ncbi:MAG TPA: FCD domain-containing protein [Pseudonocardiaceae bacterium]|nr:FCD domain-containing protein [Pseudonocardiaceae bacterium]